MNAKRKCTNVMRKCEAFCCGHIHRATSKVYAFEGDGHDDDERGPKSSEEN